MSGNVNIVQPGALSRVAEPTSTKARTEAPKIATRPFTGELSAYAKAALNSESERVANAPRGARHKALIAGSTALGELVGGGELLRSLAEDRLREACVANGMLPGREHEVEKTIRDGIEKGLLNPRRGDPQRQATTNTRSTVMDVPEEPHYLDDDQEAALAMLGSVREYKQQTESWPKSTFENINDPKAGEVDYLIDGLIPKGEVTIIGATWKTGKTLALYHLALAVLSAKRVFGRFAVPQQIRVCVFQLEMPEREDVRRFRRLAVGLGMLPGEVPAFARDGQLVHYNRPDLTLCDPGGVSAFQDAVIASGAQLVIVDSIIAAFAGADINDNSVVRKLFTSAFKKLTSLGITIILLHHKRKAPPGSRTGQDDDRSSVLGAQAWGAAAGRVFTLDRLDRKGEATESTSFCVRLAVSGSWTPEEAGEMVLEIEDKGEATTVTALDETAQAASKTLSKTEKAGLALARLVRERVSIAQKSAVVIVNGKTDISIRTIKDAVSYAKEQGWIDSHDTPGAKHGEQTLVPGRGIEEAL